MFQDPHDNVNEDFLGDEAGWDNSSIASSVIFPSHSWNRTYERNTSDVRPELSRPRSRSGNMPKPSVPMSADGSQGSNAIESLVKERAGVETGKDTVGPPIADCIAELLKTYLKDPSNEAMIKLLENFLRPSNAEWLQAPMMGTQVAASIPKRSNNYDKQLRQSQMFVGGNLAAMAQVLQEIMDRGKNGSSLLGLARKVMNAMALSGYVHFDFNTIRKGAIRQVVNPSYAVTIHEENYLDARKLVGGEFSP